MRELWLRDKRDLGQVAALLAREFDAQLEGDVENRYEWFEGKSEKYGLAFNISRATY
jgi:hypothetical protein